MFISNSRVAILIVFIWRCLRIGSATTATECDLSKVFRTPKDMSRVNFDHFELVERSAFDGLLESSTTTTTEASATIPAPQNTPNVANAQVLLRFGGDDISGSNHIMKIPPRRRYFGDMTDMVNPYLPPPSPPICHTSHYYHPYPPPVPFAFPNYYYSNYGLQQPYLPPPLMNYFRTHLNNLQLNEELSQSAAREANARPEVILLRPRILAPLNLTNEDIEKKIMEDDKDDLSPYKDNGIELEKDTFRRIQKADVESLLKKYLVPYQCPNCTQPIKMLIGCPLSDDPEPIPILASNACPSCKIAFDVDKLELDHDNSDEKSDLLPGKVQKETDDKCNKDIDRLLTVMAKELVEAANQEPEVNQDMLPIPELIKIGVDLANDISSTKDLVPLKAELDIGWKVPTVKPIIYKPPESLQPTTLNMIKVQEDLVRTAPLPIIRQYAPVATLPTPTCYFFPEPNVSIKKGREPLSKYLTVMPRGDLETFIQEGQKITDTNVCPVCRRVYPEGNYCSHCGARVLKQFY